MVAHDRYPSEEDGFKARNLSIVVRTHGFLWINPDVSYREHSVMSMLVWGAKDSWVARRAAEEFRTLTRLHPEFKHFHLKRDGRELCILPHAENALVNPAALKPLVVFALDDDGYVISL